MPLLILLAFLLFQGPPPVREARPAEEPARAVGTATVSGRVVAGDTGLPLRRVIVRLGAVEANAPDTLSGNAGYGRSVFSDADGRFHFADLPAGSYALAAIPASSLATYLGAGYGITGVERWQPIPLSKRLDLADGQSLQVDLTLPRAAAITGRVVDAFGQPVARVSVAAIRMLPEGRSAGTTTTTMTDDLGQYRVFGLVPGEYVVFVTGGRLPGSPVLPPPEQEALGMIPAYAPGVPSLARASRVRLGTGGEASLDVQVHEARLAAISGTAMTSTGEPFKGSLSVEQAELRIGGMSGGTWMSAAGAFKVERLPPGSYEVVVRHLGKGLIPLEIGIARVELAGVDVEHVMVITKPPSTLEGDIVYDDGVVDGRRAAISVASPSQRRSFSPSPTVAAAGSMFTVKQVFEPLLLRGTATDAQGDLSLKEVLLNGRDITDEPRQFSVADGRPQMVFTARAPGLSGKVTDDAGAPVEDALVVVFSDDEKTWQPLSSRVQIARPGKGGVYTLRGLREGRYFVAAVPNDVPFTPAAPDVELLRALSTTATPVLLNAGEVRTVDVRLHRPGQ